jgi:hypothetical protein
MVVPKVKRAQPLQAADLFGHLAQAVLGKDKRFQLD